MGNRHGTGMRNSLVWALVLNMAALGGWRASFAASVTDRDAAAANWVSHNGDTDETAYSRLDGINRSNVGNLGLAWSLDLPGQVTLEATPLAVNGVLYFTGTYATVYAVNAVSGKLLWKFDPKTWKFDPAKMHYSFGANRGVAYAHGRVFSAALDGRLFAFDARTGRLIWSVDTVSRNSAHYVTGAPRVFDGMVIIGNGGADFGARGYVTAYRQATGQRVWRFYTVPGSPAQNKGHPSMERAAKTWSGEYWKTGTGGGPWDSITFDRALGRIYIGTGNAGPYDPRIRSPGGGDNLYTASIVALDAKTGKFIWDYQVNPRDAWDYDSTQQLVLADLMIDGRRHRVLMQAPKNGFFYVIDRVTGKLISAEKIGKVTWARRIDLTTGRPVEVPGARYYRTTGSTVWPGSMGAHSWQTMSFDPQTGLVYVPYMQEGVRWVTGKSQPGGFDIGFASLKAVNEGPGDDEGALLAWDPVRQKPVWRVPHDTIWNGGTLATAGGLVFQGAGDGYIRAYDAWSGKKLWAFNAGLGVIAAPMTYMAGGKQYISILVGYGGSSAIWGSVMDAGWKFSAPRRLLTFAIGGKAVLPPSPPPDETVHALDDPGLKLNASAVAAGHSLYRSCAACHGLNLISDGGPAPDLRASAIALDPQSLYAVVHDGALIQHGMPRFANLSRAQIMDIYDYIRAGARKALSMQHHN